MSATLNLVHSKSIADRPGIFCSRSPPPSRGANRDEERTTPSSRRVLAGSGNGHASPRTQLPSFNNLTSGVAAEEEESTGKRKRVDGDGDTSRPATRESVRPYSSPRQEYDEEEDRLYRRETLARQANWRNGQEYSPTRDEHNEASLGAPPLHDHASHAPPMADEGYDSNVPLARRRGDAAQAKASRLHIDTGSNEVGTAPQPRTGSSTLSASHGVAKSAPPHKMSFSDRETPFDPRGEPPPGMQARGYASHPYYPSSYVSSRKDGNGAGQEHGFNDASPTLPRRGEPGQQGGQAPPNAAHAPNAHRYAVATPLTAVRGSAFVPQTATLPSPAYHTTQFMRSNPMAGSHLAPPNHEGRGSAALGGGPKTAGLNPPPTARLPEHLRSPPSSKTQFLSLFSNFYDSLTDSRTLKATLEDQVRRSNTLLQTLQKSSRVLELTVDRRMREERVLWEAKVQQLEERCLRLERRLGTDEDQEHSPSPASRRASPRQRDDEETGAAREGEAPMEEE